MRRCSLHITRVHVINIFHGKHFRKVHAKLCSCKITMESEVYLSLTADLENKNQHAAKVKLASFRATAPRCPKWDIALSSKKVAGGLCTIADMLEKEVQQVGDQRGRRIASGLHVVGGILGARTQRHRQAIVIWSDAPNDGYMACRMIENYSVVAAYCCSKLYAMSCHKRFLRRCGTPVWSSYCCYWACFAAYCHVLRTAISGSVQLGGRKFWVANTSEIARERLKNPGQWSTCAGPEPFPTKVK